MQKQNEIAQVGRVLVIAASGKTGRRVADRLEERGVEVRRGSRSGSPAFDWGDRAGWDAALAGIDAAYVVYTPDLAVPGAGDDLEAFVTAARRAGVRKLVLLSGRGEPEARACERIVEGSGLAWTVVRAGWFAQNFSEGEFAPMVESGVIALPDVGALEPFVDVDDIAEIAAAALVDAKHDGQIYEVTGPELMSYADVAEAISAATGRAVRYEPVEDGAFFAGLEAAGIPAGYRDLLAYLFEISRSGVNTRVTDGVERALGRPAGSFGAFAERAFGAEANV